MKKTFIFILLIFSILIVVGAVTYYKYISDYSEMVTASRQILHEFQNAMPAKANLTIMLENGKWPNIAPNKKHFAYISSDKIPAIFTIKNRKIRTYLEHKEIGFPVDQPRWTTNSDKVSFCYWHNKTFNTVILDLNNNSEMILDDYGYAGWNEKGDTLIGFNPKNNSLEIYDLKKKERVPLIGLTKLSGEPLHFKPIEYLEWPTHDHVNGILNIDKKGKLISILFDIDMKTKEYKSLLSGDYAISNLIYNYDKNELYFDKKTVDIKGGFSDTIILHNLKQGNSERIATFSSLLSLSPTLEKVLYKSLKPPGNYLFIYNRATKDRWQIIYPSQTAKDIISADWSLDENTIVLSIITTGNVSQIAILNLQYAEIENE